MNVKCVACGELHLKDSRIIDNETKYSRCPKCGCGGFIK